VRGSRPPQTRYLQLGTLLRQPLYLVSFVFVLDLLALAPRLHRPHS
jgi:hypothetical protein